MEDIIKSEWNDNDRKKDKQAREFKLLKVDSIDLPCKKCDSDCCGPDVPFKIEEIKEIEKVVSLKKFKERRYIISVLLMD